MSYCTYCLWGQRWDHDGTEALLCAECASDLALYDEVVQRLYRRGEERRPLILEALWRAALPAHPQVNEDPPLAVLLMRSEPWMGSVERAIARGFPEIEWLVVLEDRSFYSAPASQAALRRAFPKVPTRAWTHLLGAAPPASHAARSLVGASHG